MQLRDPHDFLTQTAPGLYIHNSWHPNCAQTRLSLVQSTITHLPVSLSLFHTTLTVLNDHILMDVALCSRQPTMSILDDWIAQWREELKRRPPGDPGRGTALFNLADSLEDRFLEINDIQDIEEAIGLHREALVLRPEGHPDRHWSLYSLAWCLGERHRKQGTLPDLEEAITLGRAALDLRPEGHPDRSNSLHVLATCFSFRYEKRGSVADLEQAITLGRAALKLRPPGQSNHARTLDNLGIYLGNRFLKLGVTADLDEAFSLHQSALDLRPEGHPDRSDSLHSLATCFSDRYNKQGSVADLEEAITLGRAALKLRTPGQSNRAWTLDNLGTDLRSRFLKLGATADLDEAFLLHQSALDLRPEGHPDRSNSLHFLATCFSFRYDKRGSVADLEQAITLGRAALKLRPPGHFDRTRTLNNLGIDLRSRFLKLGATADLDEAFSLHQSALELRPEGHPDRCDSLYSLALCLGDWYDRRASVAESEEAIALGRAASELYRLSRRTDPAITCYSLGYYLRTRFLKVGTDTDLDGAISFHSSALNLRPVDHPDRLMTLNEVVSCIGLRFEKLEAPADLDDLVALHRAILDLHPPNREGHVKSVDELLFYLRKRGEKPGMIADLDECITHGRVALGLYSPGDSGHATCFRHLIADLQSIVHKLENTSDILDLSGHTTALHNLLVCVRDVASEGQTSANVDELVAVARAALKLCPSGHSERIESLTTLATCLQHRFKQQGVVADIDDAIILRKEALQGFPPGSSDNAPFLCKLARCLSERFTKLSRRADLDDAIKFEQTALALYPLDHPERVKCLVHYRQLRVEWKSAARPDCPSGPTENSTVVQLISTTAFEALKAFPPRLLHTENGTLCDRDTQIMHFENSQEYNQLISSASALDGLSQTHHIRAVVLTYFRYVTLSHRWGKFEPLLGDIEKQVIYDLDTSTDGLLKLESFCLVCCQHGYLWAWSDTCCIDKDSSAELQEAIGSMFSWYRLSTLTVVQLADVSEGGTLASSEWFKRGWTLQELLAPCTLLFFTRKWAIYRGVSLNHKEDSAILAELEQATGISSKHIADFHPGVDDARSRLWWASTRRTTRPEDIAYSLFGVFGLHLPVLYGESAENALGRLLAEVISKSGDTSILDWVGQSSVFHSCFPATITPYQTPPFQLPSQNLTMPSNMRWFRFLTLRAVRKMYQALSRLPLTQFINFRLILPCIVHHINTIVLTRVDTSTAAHVHRIEAKGLEPIEIALSQPLENTSGTEVPYILIHPRHSNFLDASVMTDRASTCQWLTRMQRPFSALLLQELPQNEYKRIASFCHILARPKGPNGVLRGKVTTLTIV